MGRNVFVKCPCEGMQSEIGMHVGVELSCGYLDVLHTLNALVKTCKQNERPILQLVGLDVYIERHYKDMQTELEINIGVDPSCSVVDMTYTLNALVQIRNTC